MIDATTHHLAVQARDAWNRAAADLGPELGGYSPADLVLDQVPEAEDTEHAKRLLAHALVYLDGVEFRPMLQTYLEADDADADADTLAAAIQATADSIHAETEALADAMLAAAAPIRYEIIVDSPEHGEKIYRTARTEAWALAMATELATLPGADRDEVKIKVWDNTTRLWLTEDHYADRNHPEGD